MHSLSLHLQLQMTHMKTSALLFTRTCCLLLLQSSFNVAIRIFISLGMWQHNTAALKRRKGSLWICSFERKNGESAVISEASRRITNGNIAEMNCNQIDACPAKNVWGGFVDSPGSRFPIYVTRQWKSLPRESHEEHRNSRRFPVIPVTFHSGDNREPIFEFTSRSWIPTCNTCTLVNLISKRKTALRAIFFQSLH